MYSYGAAALPFPFFLFFPPFPLSWLKLLEGGGEQLSGYRHCLFS